MYNGNPTVTQTINSGLSFQFGNTGWDSTKAITFTPNSIVNLTATITSGTTGNSANYDYLKVGDVEVQVNGQDQKISIVIDGKETKSIKFGNKDACRGGEYKISMTLDQALKSAYVKVSAPSTADLETDAGTTYTNALPNQIVVGLHKGGTVTGRTHVLQAIKITEELQEVKTVDYTINYIFNGTAIKTETGSIVVGAEITAKEPQTIDGEKYYFADGATTSMTIKADSDNVLNVQMRKAYVYNYTIANNVNDIVKTGTCVEGESVSVPYSHYILKDGIVYTKAAVSSQYNHTFNPDSNDYVETLEYNASDIIDGIFFKEGEEIEGMTYDASANANIRCSNSAGGFSDEPIKICTLLPGTYTVKLGVWGNGGADFVVKAGEETILTTKTRGYWLEAPFISKNGDDDDPLNGEFTLTEEAEITFEGASKGKVLDYILISGIVDVTGIAINGNDDKTIEKIDLNKGGEYNLKAVITPETASDKTVKWSSSNPEIATVDETGKVTAVSGGTTTISVTSNANEEISASVTVNVAVPATGLELQDKDLNKLADGANLNLTEGDDYTITAVVEPEGSTDIVTWESSDVNIATVENGVIKAIAAGNVSITAKVAGFTKTINVVVAEATVPVSEVELDQTSAEMKTGSTLELKASVKPENASSKNVAWSTDKEDIATVDQNGLVTAIKAGEVTITATAGGKTATCVITITDIEVTKVILNEIEIKNIKVGETFQLTASVEPENATYKNVIWSSDNEDVATVDEDGIVTAIAPGTAIITATSGKVSASCSVTVPVEVASVTLDKTFSALNIGESVTLIATIDPENASDKTISWTSSDPKVATVDENGTVTAVSGGETIITAKAGEQTAECTVAVRYPEEEGYLYSRTTETWTKADLVDWTTTDGVTKSINNGLNVTWGNTGWALSKEVNFTKNSIVTLTASMTGGNTGRENAYEYLELGGVQVRLDGQRKVGTVVIGTEEFTLSGDARGGSVDIEMTIDQAFKKVTVNVTGSCTGTVEGKINEALPNKVVFGYNKNGGLSGDRTAILKSLAISEELQDVTTADYTINYVCDGNVIKTESGTTVVDSEVDAVNSFSVDGQKYYVADGATTTLKVSAEGENVLNVNVRKAYVFNYIVKNNVNDATATGTCVEGESTSVPYSRYILAEDGTVWMKEAAKQTPYTITINPDKDGYETTIEYSATDMTDGLFFKEAEDIEEMTATTGGNAGARGSNAQGGYADEAITVYTLKPGTYTVRIASTGKANQDLIVKADALEVIKYTTNGSWGEATSESFTLREETALTFEGANSDTPLDYILITGTAGIPATGITLDATSKELEIGKALTLTASVTPDYTTDAISWTSSNEEIATVDNEGNVTAKRAGRATITATVGEFSAECIVTCYSPVVGDANGDGVIEINDVIDISNFILEVNEVPEGWEEEEWKEFYVKAADLNGDNKVTISDALAAVTLVLAQEASSASQARVAANYEFADNLVIGGMKAFNGKTSVAVTLDNTMEFVAVQADIYMPEGVNFDVKPGIRIANSHSFQTKRFDDNHMRVVIYTFNGNAFADNDEALFEIVADSYISDPSDIALTHVIASDAAAKAHVLGSRYESATGVTALGFDSNAPVKVYDLNGRYISDKVDGLEQGFYIIRQGNNAKKVRIR